MGRSEEELLAIRNKLISRDMGQIATIRNYGADLDSKRRIDLTFWAPTEHSANELSEASKRKEMSPQLVLGPGLAEDEQRWLVRCSIAASVTFITARENSEMFLRFADEYDCEYDGWGITIIDAPAP